MRWWQIRKRDADLERELRSDLEMEEDEQRENGLPPEEARFAAQRAFGNTTLIREQTHEAWGWSQVEHLCQDVRYALRRLGRSPGFAVTAVLILALGIGANTAIFQLLDAVRLRTLPVKDPQSLALIHIDGGNNGFGISTTSDSLSYAVWRVLHDAQQGFSGVFAWADANVELGTGNDKKPTHSVWVTGDTFSTLDVAPIRGRLFDATDDRPGCGIAGAVISYGFWKAQFGGSESAIGSVVMLDDHPTQIIGVTPARFSGIDVGRSFDIALPLCSLTSYHPASTALARSDFSFLTVMGRLKPGWTLVQASDQLRSISPAIFQSTQPPGYARGAHASYTSFRLRAYAGANGISELRGSYDSALWLLLGITGLVLLLACANLGGLMLVRATARQAEMAVRLAIGASRWSLIRQLFTEAALIALAGTAVGIAIAKLLSDAVIAFLGSGNNALYLDTSLDWQMLSFLALVTTLTCVIFGLIPGLRASQTAPVEAIKSRGQTGSSGRHRSTFQKVLVAGQIAISIVLLVGAVCFVRSFTNLMTLDVGFDTHHLIIASVDFSHMAMPRQRDEPFLESLVASVQALPGVRAAAATTHVPLDGSSWSLGTHIEGEDGSSKYTWVTPGYFHAMGMQILAGRDFGEQDKTASVPVVIVNQTFVRQFLNGRGALGQTVETRTEPNYPATRYQIVGVVNDSKYASLKEQIPPQAFVPMSQYTAGGPWGLLFIRGSQSTPAVIPAVRDKLQQIAPQMHIEFSLLQTEIKEGLVREGLMATLSGFFGVLAVLLATIGLYGLISYMVARRTSEIGIRLALGASRATIARQIIGEAATLVCLGLLPGIVFAEFAVRSARSLLFGLNAGSWTSFLGAGVLLLVAAISASWFPARRAASVDPMRTLRSE
jgi:putative ABC transport system permease protein